MIQNKELKRRIIDISYRLKLGHIGSCLTAVDIIDEIYKIKKPDEEFVLSAGHAHLAHLVVMNQDQWGDDLYPDLDLIGEYGIHCDRQAGCDVSTGSLGHGIGASVGMALADRSKNMYCLLSDGECAEGSVWEALRIRQEQKLDNLKVYINFNNHAAFQKTDLKTIIGMMKLFELHENDIQIVLADTNYYPMWLKGQIAHYLQLDKKQYNELMEILK